MKTRYFTIQHNNHMLTIATSLRAQNTALLVLFHGLGCSRKTYRDIWSQDAFRDYSILALDFVGFGESTPPADEFSYEIEEQAFISAEVIRALTPPAFHIIAHSMGGAIALLLPPDLLQSAASFINLEGNLISEDCSLISRKIATVSFTEFQNRLLPRFENLLHSDKKEHLDLEKASPLGFYKSSQSLVRWSDSGRLLNQFLQLNCPKAYVYGEKNAGLPVLQKLDGVPKVIIHDSGHFMMNDNPVEFYRRLQELLPVCHA